MATSKPSNPFLWSTSAANNTDPGAAKKAAGWQLNEAPGSKEFNWLQNYFTTFIASINDHGIAPWDNASDYADGALAYHNGVIWSRTSAGSGGSQPGATNSPWAVAFAARLTNNVTVNVPSDYATMQEAFEAYRFALPSNGVFVSINIEAGHSPTTGLLCTKGDFSHFKITSSDAEVTVAVSSTTDLLNFALCRAPLVEATFNMAGNGRHGILLDRATGWITGGVKNAGSRAAFAIRGSTLQAPAADFSGAGGAAVYLDDASSADISGSNCSNSGDAGVQANGCSRIEASGVDVSGAATVGMQASGSRITAANANASGAGSVGFAVINGGIMSTAGTTGTKNIAVNTPTAQGLILG